MQLTGSSSRSGPVSASRPSPPALSPDGEQDDGVGDDDDDQREEVREDHPEDGVESFPGRRGEGVVGDALGVPGEVRVRLHVEDVYLRAGGQRRQRPRGRQQDAHVARRLPRRQRTHDGIEPAKERSEEKGW